MQKLPRIGDREDRGVLTIELTREAVSIYRQGRALATRVALDDAAAETELREVVRASYVTSSIGDSMTARYRNGARQLEVQTDITRVRPDLVRVVYATVRHYAHDGGSRNDRGVFRIRREDRSTIGFLREQGDGIEYREVGTERWGPPTIDLRAIAKEQETRGYPAMTRWLAERRAV